MKGNNFPHQNTRTHDGIRVISYKAVESGIEGCDSDLVLGNTGMVI